MPTLKKVLAVAAAVLAVVGVIACLVMLWFSWSLNTPVTESLVRIVTGAERVLAVVDRGLVRLDDGLETALGAVTKVEETVQSVGETIVETDLAFAVLERTVGDTLFPRLESASETLTTLRETVLAFNDALEAANRLPFFDVPTLTDELQTAADAVEDARTRVAEIRTEMQAIKEEQVSRPVTFVTDRTGPIADRLDTALDTVAATQSSIAARQVRLAALRERLPRLIDLISIAVTLIVVWLIAAQGYVFLRAAEYVMGRKLWAGPETPTGAEASA